MNLYTAKLFKNGGSQAVRLPKECRFEDGMSEVVVRKEGDRVILEPAPRWSERFLRSLGSWKEDIPRPPQRQISTIRPRF